MNKNEKALSLKIPIKAKKILEHYKKEKKLNKGYVFPFLRNTDTNDAEQIYIRTKSVTKVFNKCLKQIAKKCDIEKKLI